MHARTHRIHVHPSAGNDARHGDGAPDHGQERTDDSEAAARSGQRFQGIRELVTRPQAPPDAGNIELFDSVRVTCQAGGVAHSGAYCRQCTRFVNWVPSADRAEVTIRCLWSESDLVGDLMACTSVLVTVPPDVPAAKALAEATRLQTSYLLVERDGRFEGVVYRDDLVDLEDGALVRDRMIRPAWSASPTTTLGDTARLMREHGTDFMPIIAGNTLLGLITRADLANAGLEIALM